MENDFIISAIFIGIMIISIPILVLIKKIIDPNYKYLGCGDSEKYDNQVRHMFSKNGQAVWIKYK